MPALAAELVKSQVSIIFATGSPVPARAAKAATPTIPIVFAYGGDPVSDGLVESFNRTGGNVCATFIGTAQARFPSTKLGLLVVPAQSGEPYEVELLSPDSFGLAAATKVFVERECPNILTVIDGRTKVAAEAFQGATRGLHHDLMLDALVKRLYSCRACFLQSRS